MSVKDKHCVYIKCGLYVPRNEWKWLKLALSVHKVVPTIIENLESCEFKLVNKVSPAMVQSK